MSRSRCHRGAVALVLLVALAVVISACGGGSSGGSSTKSGNSSTSAGQHGAASEPSLEFVGNGPNGKLATQGKESTVEERDEASQRIEEMERAREHRNWAGQCKALATKYARQVVKGVPKGEPFVHSSTK